jgi:hypothetical protein
MRFNLHELSRENQLEFFKHSFELKCDWWLDGLDCGVSFRRKKIPGATFEEALSHFNENALSTCISREDSINKPNYWEIGFREMNMDDSPEHFLYILVGADKTAELVSLYKELGGVCD